MKTEFNSGSSIWIYGSGTFALSIAEALYTLGWQIDGFIDHLPKDDFVFQGKNWKVYNHAQVVFDERTQVVLGICNPYADLLNIVNQIRLFNPNVRILTAVELSEYFEENDVLLKNYWFGCSKEFYQEHNSKIHRFRSMLGDKNSVLLYDAILKYRIEGKIEDLPAPLPFSEQYLPLGLDTPPKNLRAIDLGACRGENLEAFLDSGRVFDFGLFFEPDLTNFKFLTEKLESLNVSNIVTLPLAAWFETVMLSFNSLGDTSSNLGVSASNKVQGVNIDSVLTRIPINYIKMDIEGAELNALSGVSRLIRVHLPHLAISAYHKPEDMWALGLYIDSIAPNKYNLFLRNYGYQTFETVLYAIPKL